MNRRCPRCGGFAWREPGRLACSLCWWEAHLDSDGRPLRPLQYAEAEDRPGRPKRRALHVGEKCPGCGRHQPFLLPTDGGRELCGWCLARAG